MFACLHGPGNLTALAFEFSPTVEETGAPGSDTVAFDVSGLERISACRRRSPRPSRAAPREIGVKANLRIAANPDAAICAARGFSGVSVIPHGDEAKFLGRLPLALLAPTPEMQETLERWGIRRFRDLAALPPFGIAERLGRKDCGCANWRAAKATGSCCRWKSRSISKRRSSWNIRWNCWSRWPSCWRACSTAWPRVWPRAGWRPTKSGCGCKLETGGTHERTSAVAGPIAGYQGVSEAAATGSGARIRRRRRW